MRERETLYRVSSQRSPSDSPPALQHQDLAQGHVYMPSLFQVAWARASMLQVRTLPTVPLRLGLLLLFCRFPGLHLPDVSGNIPPGYDKQKKSLNIVKQGPLPLS